MNIARWGLAVNDAGHLVLGGCDIVGLADQYGTPLHVVDEAALRRTYRSFVQSFSASYPRVDVFYSYKSNCVPGVLAILHSEGCGAEVISPYELWLAQHLGVDPSRIIYNGVNKSFEDLRGAIEVGVRLVNVDSLAEIRRVQSVSQKLGRPVDVGIRIHPDVGWKAHFGIEPRHDRLVAVCRELTAEGLVNVRALHTHIGSGLRSTRVHERAIAFTCSLLRELRDTAGTTIDTLDVGGGFGVPTVRSFTLPEVGFYRVFGIPPRAPAEADCASVEDFARAITGALKEHCARHGLSEPRLMLEPGRALTSSAQMLLVRVRDIKRRRRAPVAVVDGGMQNVAFPLSYEYHACLVASRARDSTRHRRYLVAGPLCSPEDVLYRNWRLPELVEGDVLAIMDAGAYFTSFANNFSYPRPSVVVVSDGRHRAVRRREGFDHMTALDEL